MSQKRGLGKGLGELLSDALGDVALLDENKELAQSARSSDTVKSLPVDSIVISPYQPRTFIDEDSLKNLADSIKNQGVLQPILVRPKKDGGFELVAGERRWRASQICGNKHIPAMVKALPDSAAMAIGLIENLQREDLNPIEEAKGLKRLADELDMTHLQVAEAVNKSRAAVTNSIRLLTLNPEVQELLRDGHLDMGHARALLALRGPMQTQVANTIVRGGLSVRETERIINRLAEGGGKTRNRQTQDPNIRRLENDLADKLGAPVFIKHSQKGKGTVLIRYNDVDELEGILGHIN